MLIMQCYVDIEDHHDTVTHYLRNISNPDAIKLGGALGLYHPNLKRMNDLPGMQHCVK